LLSAIVRLLIRWFPILSYDYRHNRIKPKQRCPGCGNKVKVEMRLVPHLSQIMCQCPVCLSCWAYNPVVKLSAWASLPKIEG
jgi:hypothetical protein